jgi:predicted nucleic acid-binding protein
MNISRTGMAYKHLFLDSDVLLDWLLNERPFSLFTEGLLAESRIQNLKVSTSVLIIANINFILGKKTNSSTAKKGIQTLVNALNILPFESDMIQLALNSNFGDFEDSIQYNIAERYNCDAIITRNIKDYKHSTIPVLTAEQFLRTL